jgi:hypothetical protein
LNDSGKSLEKQLFNRCLTIFVILEEPNDTNFAFSVFFIHAFLHFEMAGAVGHPVNRTNSNCAVILAQHGVFF